MSSCETKTSESRLWTFNTQILVWESQGAKKKYHNSPTAVCQAGFAFCFSGWEAGREIWGNNTEKQFQTVRKFNTGSVWAEELNWVGTCVKTMEEYREEAELYPSFEFIPLLPSAHWPSQAISFKPFSSFVQRGKKAKRKEKKQGSMIIINPLQT